MNSLHDAPPRDSSGGTEVIFGDAATSHTAGLGFSPAPAVLVFSGCNDGGEPSDCPRTRSPREAAALVLCGARFIGHWVGPDEEGVQRLSFVFDAPAPEVAAVVSGFWAKAFDFDRPTYRALVRRFSRAKHGHYRKARGLPTHRGGRRAPAGPG